MENKKYLISIPFLLGLIAPLCAEQFFMDDFTGIPLNQVGVIDTVSPVIGSKWETIPDSNLNPQTKYGGGYLFIDSSDPEAGSPVNQARGVFREPLSLGSDIVTIRGRAGGLTGTGGLGAAYGIAIGFDDTNTNPIGASPQAVASPLVYFRDSAQSIIYNGPGTNNIAQKSGGGDATFTTPTSEFTYAVQWNTTNNTLDLQINENVVIEDVAVTPAYGNIDSFSIGFRQLSFNTDTQQGAYHKEVSVSVVSTISTALYDDFFGSPVTTPSVIDTKTPTVGTQWQTFPASNTKPQSYYGGGYLFIDSSEPGGDATPALENLAKASFAAPVILGTDIVNIQGSARIEPIAGNTGEGILVGLMDTDDALTQSVNSAAGPLVYFRGNGTGLIYGGQGLTNGFSVFTFPTSSEFTYKLTWDTSIDSLQLIIDNTVVSTVASGSFSPDPAIEKIDGLGITFRGLEFDTKTLTGSYHKAISVNIEAAPPLICNSPPHVYDLRSGGHLDTLWVDTENGNNLTARSASGGQTEVVFTHDSRVNLGRAYTANNANLSSRCGLSTQNYTFEWWLDLSSGISPGQVVFETGDAASGLGLFTSVNGLELAHSSTDTGSDALAALSLATLNLHHYIQVVATFDTGTDTITLTANDVDGTSISVNASSAQALSLNETNGMSLFSAGDGNFSNILANTGGSSASGSSLAATPAVFDGKIGYFRILDGIDTASTSASYGNNVIEALRANDPRPNHIIIFTDDHGYADLGIQGWDNDVVTNDLTPNIDSLADEGVRFTAGYITSPQCTPSRAGIISGRYQQTFGVDENGFKPMPPEIWTLPERLGSVGYRTGMVGKWHLNLTNSPDTADWMAANGYASYGEIPEYVVRSTQPYGQGFHEFGYGELNNYTKNYNRDGTDSSPLGQKNAETGHRVDIQSEFAVEFINRNKDRPFLLYLAPYAPHTPLEWVERYNNATFYPDLPEMRRIGLSMVKAIDDGVGDILAALNAHGISYNTVIWFISDNGAPLGFSKYDNTGATDVPDGNGGFAQPWDGSLNTPLLGEKGQLAEGGIRVPFIMHWPAGLGTAPQVYNEPVISLDVTATAVALAGLPADPVLDGVNLIPHLKGTNSDAPHDKLYWRFFTQTAMRQGKWKFLRESPNTEPMLFDMTSILGEEENLIGKHPTIAAQMATDLEAWKATLFRPGDLTVDSSRANGIANWYKTFFASGLSFEFNSPGDNEGWVETGVSNAQVSGGHWTGSTSSGARLEQTTGFFVAGASADTVLIEGIFPMSGIVQLQWGHRNEPTFDPGTRSVSTNISASSSSQWLVFPMEAEAEWNKEMVTSLRIVLPDSGGQTVSINWIRISDGDLDRDGIDDSLESSSDFDNDGTPDFNDTDSDNDTQSDRIESLLKTSTTDPSSKAKISNIALNPSSIALTTTPGKPGLRYRFMRSYNLAADSWIEIEIQEPVAEGPVTLTDMLDNSETSAFYRTEIEEL